LRPASLSARFSSPCLMITPTTYEIGLLLAVLAFICWGSWAVTYKLAGKWRYELFYFDFAFGVVVASSVAALTFGSMGDELSFWDNLSLTAGRRNVAWALGAGVLINLGNLLLLASTSISGMAVAFPVGLGLAMIITQAWNVAMGQTVNGVYLAVGLLLALAAVLMNVVAYRAHAALRKEQDAEHRRAQEQIDPAVIEAAAAEQARAEQTPGADRSYRRRKKKEKADADAVGTPGKGIALALIGGLVLGCATPLMMYSRESETGLGPYAMAFVISIAMFISTFVFNLYFMNLPVQGPPVQFFRYFQGTVMQHLWGIAGGLLWAVGTAAALIVAVLPGSVGLSPATGNGLVQAAGLLAAVWGLVIWKEFKGASGFSNALMAGMILLFAAGLGIVGMAAVN
jgi:glucose uptake protein